MANQKQTAKVTSNVNTVTTKGHMTPVVERWVKVLRDDAGNIINAIGQSKLLLPPETEVIGNNNAHDEYDRIYEIYVQKMQYLDDVVKGVIDFEKEEYNFPRLEVSFDARHDYTSTGYVYAYVYNQRLIKQLIAQALDVPALSHGKFTNILGVLRFRIEGVTQQELNKLYLTYKQYIVGIDFQEKKEGERGSKSSNVNPRSAKINTQKKAVIVRPDVSDNTPKKATAEQMAILARAKSEHENNGFNALDAEI